MTRVTFGPGLNLLTGNIGTGKSTICELSAALLIPGASFRPFAHPHHPERAQAALTFQGEDGVRYRLIRDFIKDRVTLAKLDPQTPGAAAGSTPIATDAPSVEAAIQRLLPGLTAEQLRQGWLFTQAQLPSALGYGMNGAATLPATSAAPTTAGRVNNGPAGSRLEQLRRSLASAEEVTTLDEKVMAAQDRASGVAQKLLVLSRLEEERAGLKAELEAFVGFDQLPPDYAGLIDGLGERERALHSHHDGVHEQQRDLEEERATLPSEPFFKQRWFMIGAGLTGLSLLVLVLSPFVSLTGSLKLIPLGMLLAGLGLVVWAFLADMKTQRRLEQLDAKIKLLKIERDATDKRFGREQKAALDLLALTKSQTVPAFQDRMRNYQRLKESIEQLEQEQARHLGGQSPDQLEQQHRKLVDEAKELEEQMRAVTSSASGGLADVASLQAEIARLEAAQGGNAGGEMELESHFASKAPAPAVAAPVAGSWVDVLKARWPHDDPSRQAAIGALFAKLTGGQYAKVDWSDGRLRVQTASQQAIDPDLLSSGQRDLLALACFLAPWLPSQPEKSRHPVGRFPLLLDEPFLSMDHAVQSVCLQLLRAIAPTQQVILATRMTVAEQPADHRISLPLAAPAVEAANR